MDLPIITPLPTLLSSFTNARREAVRPLAFRDPNFDKNYDSDTLFYDARWAPSGDRVVLIAPPFLNLLPALRNMTVTALASKTKCSFKIRLLDRQAQIWVEAPTGTETLRLQSELGDIEVKISPNLSELFRDRRVLFTLSKNNELEWIVDWIRFHRDLHRADAVLLYDNASTRYSPEILLDAIGSVSGIHKVSVVHWPFKYGVLGPAPFWDSDYCQLGAMEHARWCCLTGARSVMNSDIDELVVSASGRSVFEAAERSWTGIIRYYGVWVVGIDEISPSSTQSECVRHRDFDIVLRPQIRWRRGCLPVDETKSLAKWTLAPRRCPASAQWRMHAVGRWLPAGRLTTSEFSHRHFRHISTHWSYDRFAYERFDPSRHVRDTALISHFDRVCWDT